MLNLNELESRWFHYKLKSYLPYFIILVSLFVITFIVLTFDFSFKNEEEKKTIPKKIALTVKKEVPAKKVQNIEIEKEIIVKSIPKIKEVQVPKSIPNIINTKANKKTTIQPSLNFMNSIKDTSPQYYDSEYQETNEASLKPVYETKKVIQEEAVITNTVVTTKVKELNKSSIAIQRQNSYEDIQHVVQRFKKSNNPALSLFAAKKYYDLANYNQAYNYSLITNELNNEIEDSWIIFAKSLVKLKQRDKAIKILNNYIEHSHSQRAKILLDNIKAGKFI